MQKQLEELKKLQRKVPFTEATEKLLDLISKITSEIKLLTNHKVGDPISHLKDLRSDMEKLNKIAERGKRHL